MEEDDYTTPDLPLDVLCLIFARLHLIRDRSAARSVSRLWNLASRERLRIPAPPLPLLSDSPYRDFPCLLIPPANSTTWKLFHSAYNDSYSIDLPELAGAVQIRYSDRRWLLVSEWIDDSAFLYNPFTRMKIPIPPSPDADVVNFSYLPPGRYTPLCFEEPPANTSPTKFRCTVFGISSTDRENEYVFVESIYLPTVRTWVRFSSSNVRLILRPSSCSAVMIGKSVYHLDVMGELTVIMPRPASASWENYAKRVHFMPNHGERIRGCYLVHGNGVDAWGVFVIEGDSGGDENGRRRVCVAELDGSEEGGWRWVPVESIGDYCMFVSPRKSFVRSSHECMGMKNMILFSRFYGESGVVYSLVTGKYHVINSGFAFDDGGELTETDYNSTWIQMDDLESSDRINITKLKNYENLLFR